LEKGEVGPRPNVEYWLLGKVWSKLSKLIPGKRVLPKRLMPTACGVRAWLVVAKALCRMKPAFCSQVTVGLKTVVFAREITWLPAESCCGKPDALEIANALVVGSLWK